MPLDVIETFMGNTKVTSTHLAKGESASLGTRGDVRRRSPTGLEFSRSEFSLLWRRWPGVSQRTTGVARLILMFVSDAFLVVGPDDDITGA